MGVGDWPWPRSTCGAHATVLGCYASCHAGVCGELVSCHRLGCFGWLTGMPPCLVLYVAIRFTCTAPCTCLATACLFSPTASSSFMADAAFPEGRKLLALYPVLLFYLSLAWMVLIGFQQGPSAAVATVPVPTVPLAAPLPKAVANITREVLVRR